MDRLCGKFGDCSFSRFGSIVRTHTHTHTHTYSDEGFTPATLIGANNDNPMMFIIIRDVT